MHTSCKPHSPIHNMPVTRKRAKMSTDNGTIEIAPEQLEQAQELLDAVNLDEVTIEIIKVKVREYRLVDILDDEDKPILDEQGNPLKGRQPYTRTARIQNFVPLPIYNKMIATQKELRGGNIEEQIPLMTDLVLEVWQVSEPFMTLQKLNDGIDFPVIGALFKIFFNQNRLQKNRA